MLDLDGAWLCPGFIDLQINGAFGIDVTTEPHRIRELGARLARHGVTSFLPTVITCRPDRRAAALAAWRTLAAGGPPDDGPAGAVPLGLHLEGPMLSPTRHGAHPVEHLAAPSLELIDGWSAANGVALVTMAPELPGALEVIGALRDRGVAVSIGHTDCSAAEFVAARAAGAAMVTHLFNAMRPFTHRDPGPIGAALADPSVVCGLVADGVHVDPVAVAMAARACRPDRLALVTDAVAAMGASVAPTSADRLGSVDVVVREDGVRTAGGVLAGSVCPLDRAVRNLIGWTEYDIPAAVRTVTARPGARARPARPRSDRTRRPRRPGRARRGRRCAPHHRAADGSCGRHEAAPLTARARPELRRGRMEIVIVTTATEAAAIAAAVVEHTLRVRPTPMIGLATGSTPLAAYALLVERHRVGALSFAGASAVLLDDYVGLPPDHPEGYRAVIRREFADHVDLPPARLYGPDVWSDDLPAACAAYDALLADLGGVDLQLLGIGTDGHIGFNEPGSSLRSRDAVKTLTAATRADNARFFSTPDDVPHHVVTQGLGTIGDARHLLLLATGSAKAPAVAAAVEGPLAAVCPASVLQLHPTPTVVLDEAAAAGLRLADYYRETYRGKPSWQTW